jgi:uncharacterized protein YukE
MATFAFAALGFDPAPGNPDHVEALAQAASRTATAIGLAGQRLRSARTLPHWDGHAADAFDVDIGRLPTDLDRASAAYGHAGSALRSYSAELRAAQTEARVLEDQARRAGDRARATLVGDPATLLRVRADAADEQAEAIRGARRLADRVEHAGDQAAALLRAAGDAPPYRRPGLLAQAVTAIDGWIDDNAETVRTVSSGLKVVSAVAGLLAFVPALTPVCAPLALASAGVALGIDAALSAAGQGSWRRVAVDAVTTLLPGGRVVRVAGATVTRYDRVLDAVNHGARVGVHGDLILDENVGRKSRDAVAAFRVGDRSNAGARGAPGAAAQPPAQPPPKEVRADTSVDGGTEIPHRSPPDVAVSTVGRDAAMASDQHGLSGREIEELMEHAQPGGGSVQ